MDTGKPVSFIFFNLEQKLFLCSIDPVSVQLFGGPGLGVGLVDGVFDNNIWEKTGVTCHAGEQYLHSDTLYIFGTGEFVLTKTTSFSSKCYLNIAIKSQLYDYRNERSVCRHF